PARKLVDRCQFGGVDNRRFFEKTSNAIVCEQEGSCLTGERFVALRVERQPLVTPLGGLIECAAKESLEALPLFGRHRHASAPSSGAVSTARFSQARAMAHCRFTVAGDIPTTSAVSSTVRPPKYRSSTMRACSGSNVASRVSASSSASMSTPGGSVEAR